MRGQGTSRGTAYSWTTFAAAMLVVTGGLNLCQGLIVLLSRGPVGIDGGRLILVDLPGWGAGTAGAGALLVLAGAGLYLAGRALRFVAVVLVTLHALAQLLSLPAGPAWSPLMLGLDAIMLFALVAPRTAAPVQAEPYRPPHRARHYADARLAPQPRRPDRRRLLLPAGSTVYASASATGQPPLARVTLVRPTEVTRVRPPAADEPPSARATARVPEPASHGLAPDGPDRPPGTETDADPGRRGEHDQTGIIVLPVEASDVPPGTGREDQPPA